MTVATTSTKEFSRREILRRALQKARLLNSAQNPSDTNPKVQAASDALEMKLADLQAEGVIVTTAELATLSLTANTPPTTVIALPADTLDVQGTATLLTSTTAAGEVPVFPMGQEEWERLTDKTVLGTPSRYYVHRLLSVSLYLWPGVSATASGWTLRYRRARLLQGNGDGTTTMDLHRHWTTYLVYAVAHELAVDNSMPSDVVAMLRTERDRLRTRSLAYNRPRGPIQIHSTHRGPWR
jgi:hypothetical protein